jgi:hypothetical protein
MPGNVICRTIRKDGVGADLSPVIDQVGMEWMSYLMCTHPERKWMYRNQNFKTFV